MGDIGKKFLFFIDDNVFFFQDILVHRFRSIFEQFYLRGLRELHLKYGAKFTLNCFYSNWHDPTFNLSMFPDSYRAEFEVNSQWLKFAFHALCEYPEHPYTRAFPEKLPEHYELVTSELARIAGEVSVIPPIILHYFDDTPEIRKFMYSKGMRYFVKPDPGDVAAPHLLPMRNLPVDAILNLFGDDVPAIAAHLKKVIATGRNLLCVGTHEQYAYRGYKNYIPSYFSGLNAAFNTLADNGFECVYFNEL